MNSVLPLVQIRNLSKTFVRGYDKVTKQPIRVHALQDVSLDIHPGELIAVIGPSGSGKSTLIHCLGSFDRPDDNAHGSIRCRVDGQLFDIWDDTAWYRQNFVGIVFQAFHLLPTLNVVQNVQLPLTFKRCQRFSPDPPTRLMAAQEALREVGLDPGEFSDCRTRELSGGESQRVAIARGIVKNPSLLLADEPTGNLDEKNKELVVSKLRDLAKGEVAVLMVTHDPRFAEKYADRVITLIDGKLQPEKVLQQPDQSARATPPAKPLRVHQTGTQRSPASKPTKQGAEAPAEVECDASGADQNGVLSGSETQGTAPDASEAQKAAEHSAAPEPVFPTGESDSASQTTAVPAHAKSESNVRTAVEGASPFAPEALAHGDQGSKQCRTESRQHKQVDLKVRASAGPVAGPDLSAGKGREEDSTPKAGASLHPSSHGLLKGLFVFIRSLRLPGCDQTVVDLISQANRDAKESSVSLASNVVAVLFGTILTSLLIALLVGTVEMMKHMMPMIPSVDAVQVWVPIESGAPMKVDEFNALKKWPGATTAIPSIQQSVTLFEKEIRDDTVTMNSSVSEDPDTARLQILKGSSAIDPDGWDVLLDERVATELNNFNPLGLVGKTITMRLCHFENTQNPDKAKAVEVLDFPVRVVGIVKESPRDRVYGSLNMVRFTRDYSAFRSDYVVKPGEKVDPTRVSDRTRFETVRVHFGSWQKAEKALRSMKERLGGRFNLYWSGSEMGWAHDLLLVASWVLGAIGVLTICAGSISLFNTLRASVARKSREIGIFRALGASRGDIFVMYVWQALLVGALAGLLGISCSWLGCWRLNAAVSAKWPDLRDKLFLLPIGYVLLILAAVLAICFLAAMIPSWGAARKTPRDALDVSS